MTIVFHSIARKPSYTLRPQTPAKPPTRPVYALEPVEGTIRTILLSLAAGGVLGAILAMLAEAGL